MRTVADITDRYKSDVRYIRDLYDRDCINRVEYDDMMEQAALHFDGMLEMLALAASTAQLERVLQYN